MLFLALILIAGTALAGVVNSKHDFSSLGTGGIWGSTDTDQVCIFCHTPHNATMNVTALWNRTLPAQVFNTYASSTMDTLVGQPQGVTLMCLSCHDGSVAIDAFNNGRTWGAPRMKALGDIYYPGSPYYTGMGPNIGGNYTGNANVNNLADDHPVSFTYGDPYPDTGIKARAGIGLPLYGAGKDQLECGTCHNPHGVGVLPKFLRATNAGSQLCLRCHNK
jgi:predicted CXXCH cytochrome family protein